MRRQKTIFVVEDDEEFGDLIKMRLEALGCCVLIERDGEKALEAIRQAKPDLIVLDVFLPDVDGLTVLKQLKAPYDIASGEESSTKDIPVIIITGRAPMVENITRIAGAADFFIKPVNMPKFIEKISAILELPQRNGK